MDEPIRSQIPNDNYRRGWEETFGKAEGEPDVLPRRCRCGYMTCDRCRWLGGFPSEAHEVMIHGDH